MIPDEARQLWCTLAGDETALQPGTTTVVRGSWGICPPGWTGVVRLGDGLLIEAGNADDAIVEVLRSLDDPSDPAQVARAFPVADTRGPGELAYLPKGGDVAALDGREEVREVSVASIRGWLDLLPDADVEESSVADMDRALVVGRGDQLLGAAGHLDWPAAIGHIGVLVAPHARGQGVGRILGAAATRWVLDRGRTPQWRAASSNEASREVAKRMGYREMGRQFSFQPA